MSRGEELYGKFLKTTAHYRKYKLAKLNGEGLENIKMPSLFELSVEEREKFKEWSRRLIITDEISLNLWVIEQLKDENLI